MEAGMALMSLVVFGALFLTLACGIWVGFALFMVGLVGMSFFSSLPAGNNMASSVWATVEKWEYVALPMFILMGEILYRSGISEKLFRALVPWLYRLPGGAFADEYHLLHPVRSGFRFQCGNDRYGGANHPRRAGQTGV